MSGRVSQHVETIVVRRHNQVDHRVRRRDERKIAELAVDARRDRLRGKDGTDRLPLGELGLRTVDELHARHAGHNIGRLPAYSYEMDSSTFSLAARRAGQIAASTPTSPARNT